MSGSPISPSIANKITVIIQTRNEAGHIAQCIRSARYLSDDISVIDMQSTDATCKQAQEAGANCLQIPHEHYVEMARAWAIRQATTDWVFLLDADERINSKLAHEIKQVLRQDHDRYAAYRVPRLEFYGERYPLRHGGWWPNYQFRLICKSKLVDWPKRIHSAPTFAGPVSELKQPILHYSKGNFAMMVEKTLNFENIEADLLFKAGRRASTIIFFRKFFGELYRRLFKNLGFLDGEAGFLESFYQAFSKTITYLLLYEKHHLHK